MFLSLPYPAPEERAAREGRHDRLAEIVRLLRETPPLTRQRLFSNALATKPVCEHEAQSARSKIVVSPEIARLLQKQAPLSVKEELMVKALIRTMGRPESQARQAGSDHKAP